MRWSKDEFNPAAIAVPYPTPPAHDGLPAAATRVPDLPPGTELAAAIEAESHAGSAIAPGTIASPHHSPPSSRPASDPRSAGEALSGDFGPPAEWLAAMEDELKRLINDFHAFVPMSRRRLPRDARPIPTTWVFKTKPTRLKARCVASQLKSQYQVADKNSPDSFARLCGSSSCWRSLLPLLSRLLDHCDKFSTLYLWQGSSTSY